jgi:hypothetical protein
MNSPHQRGIVVPIGQVLAATATNTPRLGTAPTVPTLSFPMLALLGLALAAAAQFLIKRP